MSLTIIDYPSSLAEPLSIGQIANQVAGDSIFVNFRSRRARSTIIRHDTDLRLFADYLAEVGVMVAGDLATEPKAWTGITWGLIESFVQWQLKQGFAVSSVNVRLSTVKTYAKLAVKAGTLDRIEYAVICTVVGYSNREARRLDEMRRQAGQPTRCDRPGAKKSEPVPITREQVSQLKKHPDIPQGRRDALMMCLLLDHGLRCGEVALLSVSDFNLQAGAMTFYRPKVGKTQTHKLTADTLTAARNYFAQDALETGQLLRGSHKNGHLRQTGMGKRAITKRVKVLGEALGIKGLSAHDCRHAWATRAVRSGTMIDRLQDAGGWSSLAMPLRYIEAAKIANEGVRLE